MTRGSSNANNSSIRGYSVPGDIQSHSHLIQFQFNRSRRISSSSFASIYHQRKCRFRRLAVYRPTPLFSKLPLQSASVITEWTRVARMDRQLNWHKTREDQSQSQSQRNPETTIGHIAGVVLLMVVVVLENKSGSKAVSFVTSNTAAKN